MEQDHEIETLSVPTSQPLLVFYSHARSPPLHPPPDLKYDVRSIPNPPKALRDVSDGRSKRLREHLLSEPRFVEKLKEIERDVTEAMKKKIADWEDRPNEESGVEKGAYSDMDDQKPHAETGDKSDNPTPAMQHDEGDEEEVDDTEDSSEDSPDSPDSIPISHPLLIRVGCNCALGHHRSVAMVQELSQLPWPQEWQVHIVHRDLGRKRAGGVRERQKAQFRGKRREQAWGVDDE